MKKNLTPVLKQSKVLYLLPFLLLIAFVACNKTQTKDPVKDRSYVQWSEEYLNSHIALTNIRQRALENSGYVTEITLKNFSGDREVIDGFGFQGKIFGDDGKTHDLKAGDGIYTSKEVVPFPKNYKTNSAHKNYYVVGSNFKHTVPRNAEVEDKIKITCKFVRCGCPSNCGPCPACTYTGWDCWKVEDCEVSIEW